MKVVAPVRMTDGQVLSSNVPENDYSAWSASTTYSQGDFVISTETHKVYRSAVGDNLNHPPTVAANIGLWWTEWSATNRWKAFDNKLADAVTNADEITYSITPASSVDAIAFFNVGASAVRVQVYDDSAVEIYDQTATTIDDSAIVDPYTFHTTDLSENYSDNALFTGFTAEPGYQIDIAIGVGAGIVSVGEIVLGKRKELGITLVETEIGLDSFSIKEQDEFGNWTVVPRPKTDPMEFRVTAPFDQSDRIKRVLSNLRDTPVVYYADEDTVSLGAITFGFFRRFRIPLQASGNLFFTLKIESLT